MNKDLLLIIGAGAAIWFLSNQNQMNNGNTGPTILPSNNKNGYSPDITFSSEEEIIRDRDDRGIYGRNPFPMLPYPSVAGWGAQSSLLGPRWVVRTRRQNTPCVWHSMRTVL